MMIEDDELVQALRGWSLEFPGEERRLVYIYAPEKLLVFTLDRNIEDHLRLKKIPNKAQEAAMDYQKMKIGVFLPDRVKSIIKERFDEKPVHETGEFIVPEKRWRIIPKLTDELIEIHRIGENVDRFYREVDRYSTRSFGKEKAEKIALLLRIKQILGGRDIYDRHDSRYIGGGLALLHRSRGTHQDETSPKTQYIFGTIVCQDNSTCPEILSIYHELPQNEHGFIDWLKDQTELSLAMGPGFKGNHISVNFRFNSSLIEELREI